MNPLDHMACYHSIFKFSQYVMIVNLTKIN
uniref:Uncharacterized protein n=1 Tax=Arundo donax TaxID=35708 RepID=A0A0A9A002_ARUDO